MPGQTLLIHAVPGTGLSEEIHRFTSHLKQYPLSSWMILPTKRLVRTVSGQLLEAKISFLPENICTLDEMCERLVGRYGKKTALINKIEARLLLVDILHEHKEELSLFFSEKTPSPRAVQDLQTLLQVIIRREIPYPDCLGPLASEKSYQIDLLMSAYKERLIEKDLVDPDTLLSWVIEFLKITGLEEPDSFIKHVHIYGLFEPMPLEIRLIKAIRDICETLTYTLPTGNDASVFSDNGIWLSPDKEEFFPCPELNNQITSVFFHDPAVSKTQLSFPHLSCMGFADPMGEMNEIARKVAHLVSSGASYEDIAIVSPDLRSTLGYAKEAFAEFYIPLKPSQGPLLVTSPLVSYYLIIFDLIEKGFRYEELVKVIQSPYSRYRWKEDDSPEDSSPYQYLSYGDFDLICRTYGLDGGYIDWKNRLIEIISLCNDTEEQKSSSDSMKDSETGKKNTVARTYSPRRPLSKSAIEKTVQGVIRFVDIFKGFREKRTIQDHIKWFTSTLKEIGSPVPGYAKVSPSNAWLTEEEYLHLTSFSSLLKELQNLSEKQVISDITPEKQISFVAFLSIVRHILQEKTSDINPDASGVMLTGMREIVHQHYPYVFLVSLNEGQIPRLTTRLPFTNSSESSRMDTRTLADILRQEKYQFIAGLLAGVSQVYLSWYDHKDERTTLSSVFIDYLKTSTDLPEWEPSQIAAGGALLNPEYSGSLEASYAAGICIHQERWEEALSYILPDVTLSTLVDRITIERTYRFRLNRSEYDGLIGGDSSIHSLLHSAFGARYKWSASMLETYVKCPFRFYLERVAHIRPLPDIGSDIPPETKGNLIHGILSRFTRTMLGENLLPLTHRSYDSALLSIREIATDECDKVPYATPLWHAKKRQIMGGEGIGEGILERFIAAEIDRLAPDEDGRVPHVFTPQFFELSFGAVPGPDDDPHSKNESVDLIAIQRDWENSKKSSEAKDITAHPLPPDTIEFIGKIDRIDITPDDLFGIVDYKTGKNIPGTSDLTRMTALQLPLYLLAYQKISHKKPVFGSYVQVQRKITHSIPLYDPTLKQTLPKGKLPRSEPRWHEILENALQRSISHVHAIRAGLFPIQATSECSADWYCPYKTICRFQPDRGSQLGEWFFYPADSTASAEDETGAGEA